MSSKSRSDHGHDLYEHLSTIDDGLLEHNHSETGHDHDHGHNHGHGHLNDNNKDNSDHVDHTSSNQVHDHVHDDNCNCLDHNRSNSSESHQNHGHSHEHLDHPGAFSSRDIPKKRKYNTRAFCVGIGGPVGSGKTALMLALCQKLKSNFNLCAVTNDIFTKEDGEFLLRHNALDSDRIVAVETGGCPHAAIREDITANLIACEDLTAKHNCDMILLESGGDNLAADFSRELADFTIYVIDTAGGDKIPRKGGPGITQSDLLVINKTDLCEAVGASMEIMERDAKLMRKDGQGPFLFAQVKHGKGVDEIVRHIELAYYSLTNK